jgi:hypothetical protein
MVLYYWQLSLQPLKYYYPLKYYWMQNISLCPRETSSIYTCPFHCMTPISSFMIDLHRLTFRSYLIQATVEIIDYSFGKFEKQSNLIGLY